MPTSSRSATLLPCLGDREIEKRAHGLDELVADAEERVEARQGSWKIIPMRLPRTPRIASSDSPSMRSPPSRISPPTILPGGSTRTDDRGTGDRLAGPTRRRRREPHRARYRTTPRRSRSARRAAGRTPPEGRGSRERALPPAKTKWRPGSRAAPRRRVPCLAGASLGEPRDTGAASRLWTSHGLQSSKSLANRTPRCTEDWLERSR